MTVLDADKRRKMPSSAFALSGKRFPMNDAVHQRMAISGATRSERAGNISASTADRIKAEARHKLGISPGGYAPNSGYSAGSAPNAAAVHPRTHALTMASATHLHNQGHISDEMRNDIHEAAQQRLAQHKAQQGVPKMAAPRKPFGSLAPMMPMGQPPMGGDQGGM